MAGDRRRRAIGARLRRVRMQQGLSLADVEERSGGRLKAVVVGAYERGDRAVNLSRLHRLAEFYRVPMAVLLPGREGHDEPTAGVVLDLTALEPDAPEPVGTVARFADQVRHLRGDHNGAVLSLRRGDLHTLALTLGMTREQLLAQLQERNLARAAGDG